MSALFGVSQPLCKREETQRSPHYKTTKSNAFLALSYAILLDGGKIFFARDTARSCYQGRGEVSMKITLDAVHT
jgi:hypothetical protein